MTRLNAVSLPIRTMANLTMTLSTRRARLLIAVLAAGATVLTMPPFGWWPLTFLTSAVLLWCVRGQTARHALGIGFASGFVFYAAQTSWLTTYLGPVPWLALSILEGALFALGSLGLMVVWRLHDESFAQEGASSLGRTLAKITSTRGFLILGLALVWVAREWITGHLPYGGFQWSRLGQTQSATLLARWSYWGGVSAVSLSVAVISATFLVLVATRFVWTSLIPAAASILIPLFTFINASGQGSAVIGAVQGNANAGLFANYAPGSILEKHIATTRLMLRDPMAKHLDFTVWPENSSDRDPLQDPFAHQDIVNLVNHELKRPLVLGAVTWRNNKVFNSSMVFEPNRDVRQIYDKKRPVPFAEYVPDRPFWYAVAPSFIGLIQRGFDFGSHSGVMKVAGARAGALICFEIAIDDVSHDLVSQGAQVILSQANNADFAKSAETFQQEALARLQAMATGRSIVHVSTVGVTEVIRADGSISGHLKPFERGYLIKKVTLSDQLTPAMRFYGWVDNLALVFTLIALANYLYLSRARKRQTQKSLRLQN